MHVFFIRLSKKTQHPETIYAVRRNICVYLSSLPRSEKQHLFRISPCIIISCRGLARTTLHTNQCSRKRVQQLKKRKKSCFFEI